MYNFVILCVIVLLGTSYSSVEGAPRIIGGIAASEKQFLYMVSLQLLSEVDLETRGHRCGGALITYSHALTAASCLYYQNNQGIFIEIFTREYRLFAGSERLDNDDASRIRSISNFTMHPEFDPRQPYINDIAIITTSEAFPTNVVTPLNLPVGDVTVNNPSNCQSPGWGGQDSSASASYHLMYTESYVTENGACSRFYSKEGTMIDMQPSMLCAVPYMHTSGCQGDIGNPLVCNNDITGILFLSKTCSSPIETSNPDVYTSVFSYKAWIEETTNGASTYQLGIGLLAMLALVQIVIST
uniref:Peptidase S1 domain-containing protein n=1 Tax=Heliothis virescens TaxID=7102 RepID=A0A2A4JFE9_HELVI